VKLDRNQVAGALLLAAVLLAILLYRYWAWHR